MDGVKEAYLIALREIRKNIRSVKGLVMVIISLLGAVGTALLLQKLRGMDEAKLPPDQLKAFQQMALEKKYGDADMAKYLSDAPPVLLAMLLITVWLAPMLVSVMGFDSVSGEMQNRTVRYWSVRSSRLAYFAGKFFGLWSVVSIVILVMHMLVWGIAAAKTESSVIDTLSWGVRFWLVTVPIAGAWCGIAMLVSSQFKSPIIALLVTFATFFGLWIFDAIGLVGDIKQMTYVYPNTYDSWLLSNKADKVALGTLICLAFAAVGVGGGSLIFARRDV